MHVASTASPETAFWNVAFARVSAAMPYGPTLHLPSDRLDFATARPGMLTTHASPGPGVLCVCSAEALPFPAETFACLVGFDVLGRSPRPSRILSEAARVLAPGGRAVLVEPWTGPIGTLFHLRRHRRVAPGLDPWFDAGPDNAAAPRECLDERADELSRHAPGLKVIEITPFGGLAEILAAREGMTTGRIARHLARLDRLPGALGRMTNHLLSTRVLYVIEKRRPPTD
ncbi:MAG: methyltransferase domain-containing protein [Rhodospirillaceae bacterium]